MTALPRMSAERQTDHCCVSILGSEDTTVCVGLGEDGGAPASLQRSQRCNIMVVTSWMMLLCYKNSVEEETSAMPSLPSNFSFNFVTHLKHHYVT